MGAALCKRLRAAATPSLFGGLDVARLTSELENARQLARGEVGADAEMAAEIATQIERCEAVLAAEAERGAGRASGGANIEQMATATATAGAATPRTETREAPRAGAGGTHSGQRLAPCLRKRPVTSPFLLSHN